MEGGGKRTSKYRYAHVYTLYKVTPIAVSQLYYLLLLLRACVYRCVLTKLLLIKLSRVRDVKGGSSGDRRETSLLEFLGTLQTAERRDHVLYDFGISHK